MKRNLFVVVLMSAQEIEDPARSAQILHLAEVSVAKQSDDAVEVSRTMISAIDEAPVGMSDAALADLQSAFDAGLKAWAFTFSATPRAA